MSETNRKSLTAMNKIVIISISCALIFAVALTLILYFTLRPIEKIDLDFSATQIDNTQQVKVVWETSMNIDQVQITVKDSGKNILNSVTIANPTAVAKGFAEVEASYGKRYIEVSVRHGKTTASAAKQINVFTDEYVIAPLVATMPVTFFSLSLPEYTNNYSVPTFIWLQRGGAWDYSQLHENVYMMPSGSYSEMSTSSTAEKMYDETAAWIRELHEINPNSKFHLYYNDFHPWGWMQATVANRLPEECYDVTLLSDGTGSYAAFAKYLNLPNAVDLFENMCKDYQKLKAQIAQKGNYSVNDSSLAIKSNELRHYVYCMLTDEINVQLVLARDFVTNDMPKDSPIRPRFLELIANADNPDRPIKIRSMYSLLSAMSEEERTDLKNLYKFSDSMFDKAAEEDKKIMIFLGTRTDLETNFDDLVKATIAYYGDEYVYYYKGHPGTPTQMDEKKIAKLDELGLIDIDSTISAELIFFFNQEACASGYGSSTYNSLLDRQVCGVWANSIDSINSEYRDKVDYVLHKLEPNDSKYGSITTGGGYLFEFADKTNYDVAVYYDSTNSIKYFKQSENGFTEVHV